VIPLDGSLGMGAVARTIAGISGLSAGGTDRISTADPEYSFLTALRRGSRACYDPRFVRIGARS